MTDVWWTGATTGTFSNPSSRCTSGRGCVPMPPLQRSISMAFGFCCRPAEWSQALTANRARHGRIAGEGAEPGRGVHVEPAMSLLSLRVQRQADGLVLRRRAVNSKRCHVSVAVVSERR